MTGLLLEDLATHLTTWWPSDWQRLDRKLDPDMLVIADRNRPQAVAGVMGGAAAEVSGATSMVA